MSEPLWTQKETADFLRVSVRYLRDSNCPKLLLPSATGASKPLLRYDPEKVRAWAEARKTEAA